MYQEVCRNDRTLRDYQQEAKKQIFESWEDCDNVMFQMPTGTGKTRLFTSIISDIKAWSIINQEDARVLIIAHRVELIEQISESLNRYKVSHGIIAGGHERNIQAQVQVASIQTITHRANIEVARSLPIRFIIIDEAHHSTANSYKKLWELYPSAKKLGVTATPWRMNHQGFAKIYDKLILSRSIKEFIEQGWLSPYCFYSIGSGSKVTQEINSINEFDIEGDYKISALEKTIDQSAIRAQLLDSYLKFAKGKKGIIYSISRKHSDHICAEYKAKGVNIVRIDSETPREERRLYVQKFRKGQIDIIVNVAFNEPMLYRTERAKRIKEKNFLEKFQGDAKRVLEVLMQTYADQGILAFEENEALKNNELQDLGTPIFIKSLFGGKEQFKKVIRDIEEILYAA